VFEGTIGSLTATVCGLFGIDAPALTSEPMLASNRTRARGAFGDRTIERALVYCPDALGDHVWARCPEHVRSVEASCPQGVRVSSVVPPKTPVCFASVFTGAPPERHGVRQPERHLLTATPCSMLSPGLASGSRSSPCRIRAST
jgi:hypothetical protein